MFSRRIALSLFAVTSLVGCPKNEEEKKDDDDRSKSDDDKDDKPAEAKPSNAELAFALGRKYAFACVFALLDKPESVTKNISQSETTAKALGVTPPTAPSKEDAMSAMRATTLSDEIAKKHDAKVAAAYSLGVTATDMSFGTALGSEISSQLGDAEKHAKAAGVPEDAFKAKLDAAKASATEGTVEALNGVFDAHFKYRE